uniref:Uncharacterized protein n=1 Tax=Trypanosoma vivax (strain Y486) TaxID=1055687 RepID=G0UBL2_TRYVY|nr:conserved hypothetical protein [Trypanosoma vivax Y486]
MLKEQLDAQRTMYESERANRLSQEREREREHEEMVASQLATIEQLQSLHQASLSDLIRGRHEMQIEQRELRVTIEHLRASLRDAHTALEEERRRHALDLQQRTKCAVESCAAVSEKLRQELRERRASAAVERERHHALLKKYEEELTRLRQERTQEKRRFLRQEERHRLEQEGVNSEVNLMRQALRAMEKRVYFSQASYLSL